MMISFPIKQGIAWICLGILVDLSMASRAKQNQVLERISIEVIGRSIVMAWPSVTMRDDMGHFSYVFISTHFSGKKGFKTVWFLTIP